MSTFILVLEMGALASRNLSPKRDIYFSLVTHLSLGGDGDVTLIDRRFRVGSLYRRRALFRRGLDCSDREF